MDPTKSATEYVKEIISSETSEDAQSDGGEGNTAPNLSTDVSLGWYLLFFEGYSLLEIIFLTARFLVELKLKNLSTVKSFTLLDIYFWEIVGRFSVQTIALVDG